MEMLYIFAIQHSSYKSQTASKAGIIVELNQIFIWECHYGVLYGKQILIMPPKTRNLDLARKS